MSYRITRRDLLRWAGISSGLSFVPNLSESIGFAQGGSQASAPKPKIRAVIRLQMYAGWDVLMGANPPREKYHTISATGGKRPWMVSWNYPSGVLVNNTGLSFGDGASANADKALLIEERLKSKLGSDFVNNLNASLRIARDGVPGTVLANDRDFIPIAGSIGMDPAQSPFAALSQDSTWSKIYDRNPSVVLGPLMHQFLANIDRDPTSSQSFSDSYADYMTIINGIDTNGNVSHDFGAILAACGYAKSGVGNGANLMAISDHMPSFEVMMANQLLGDRAGDFLPSGDIPPAFVSALTFNDAILRRGYVASTKDTALAQLFDVRSLKQLAQQTAIAMPLANASDPQSLIVRQQWIDAMAKRLAEVAGSKTQTIYRTFLDMVHGGGLGIDSYTDAERAAFDNMVEIYMEKSRLTGAANVIPPIRWRSRSQNDGVTDYRRVDPRDLRQSLDPSREGSWQNNLATAAMMVRRGLSRGVAISFGGHNDFIPDTHFHNDHVQTVYQGIFWDGVRRLVNYLKWNKDEEGAALLDSTLVIVTADITRGPVFFDQGLQGKSDYRNNSMVIIGGGLKHKTQKGSSELPGRVIGYSHTDLSSGRIDYTTGAPTAIPKNSQERPEQKITFQTIYASLMECYGMDKERYFKGVPTIGPLAKNQAGQADEG